MTLSSAMNRMMGETVIALFVRVDNEDGRRRSLCDLENLSAASVVVVVVPVAPI